MLVVGIFRTGIRIAAGSSRVRENRDSLKFPVDGSPAAERGKGLNFRAIITGTPAEIPGKTKTGSQRISAESVKQRVTLVTR